jgi:preprotein translocase subunit SecG
MLSFLREQGLGGSSDKQAPQSSYDKAGGQDNASVGNTQEQQYLTVAAKGKNVHKMTMLLTVLFGIGLLGLVFMIKKSVPGTAAASSTATEETQIEKAIERLTGVGSELFSRMDQIVKKFYEFSDVRQVGVNELVKNPFEYEMFLTDAGKNSDSKGDEIKAELIRRQRIEQGTKGLQLFTICQMEKGNCCMINDKILYEGDSIDGYKVGQIGDDFVKLELEGVEKVLPLSK